MAVGGKNIYRLFYTMHTVILENRALIHHSDLASSVKVMNIKKKKCLKHKTLTLKLDPHQADATNYRRRKADCEVR